MFGFFGQMIAGLGGKVIVGFCLSLRARRGRRAGASGIGLTAKGGITLRTGSMGMC